jgi:FdhE protein
MYRELLDLFEGIRTVQEEARKFDQPERRVSYTDYAHSGSRAGPPLMEPKDFTIDIESATGVFQKLCTVIEPATPKTAREIPRIIRACSDGTLDLDNLLRAHHDDAYLKRVSHEMTLDDGVLGFVVIEATRPFIEAQAAVLLKKMTLLPDAWSKKECPLCGSMAHIAVFEGESGQRRLECSFCGCVWAWKRLACAYCGNEDTDTLSYFKSEEGDEAYRVDLCDQCSHYIKTVDSRALNYEPDLWLEDLVTLHFDMLALERGYTRPVAFPLGQWIVEGLSTR